MVAMSTDSLQSGTDKALSLKMNTFAVYATLLTTKKPKSGQLPTVRLLPPTPSFFPNLPLTFFSFSK